MDEKQLSRGRMRRPAISPAGSDSGHAGKNRLRPVAVGCALLLTATVLAGCLPLGPQMKDNRLNDVLRTTAISAESENDYLKAVRHFRSLHARDPKNSDAIQSLARNLRYSGQPKQAAAFLVKQMQGSVRKPALVLELAKAQLAASLMDEAHLSLVEAEHLLPGNWQVHSAWGVYNDHAGNFDEARQNYEKALELSPNNFAVLNNMALSQALAGNIDEGITTLRKLADGKDSTSLVRQNLALLYGIKGDLDAAKRLAQKDLPKDEVKKNLSAFRDFHE